VTLPPIRPRRNNITRSTSKFFPIFGIAVLTSRLIFRESDTDRSVTLHTAETVCEVPVDRHNGKGARVKRSITVAAAATAIVVVGLSGCSSNKSSTGSSGASSGQSTAAAAGSSGTAAAKVTIDGKDQNVQGAVACNTMSGNVNIAVGGTSTGIGAVLTDANPPAVKSVGLGSVNGVVLGYSQGTPQGNATATKDGSSYKISGTATGVDASNPMAGPVNKSFEIDVTCP
jgi:ipoprotein LpqH